MKLPEVYLSGIGTYVPETTGVGYAIEQGWLTAEDAERTGLTGAACAGETPAPDMALWAGQQAVARADVDPESLDVLLYADNYHSGPDGWFPQFWLQRHLVGGDLLAAQLRQGCNGMFGALELAATYLIARGGGTAMTVASDNSTSPLVNRWRCLRPDFIIGDAATAVVLTTKPGFARLKSASSITVPELEGMHRGDEPMFPPGATVGRFMDFAERIDFFGFEHRDTMLHSGLNLLKTRSELIDRVLAEAGIGLDGVSRIAYNHGSRQYVEDGLLTMLGIPLEKSNWDFGRGLGHLGASDQVASLAHMLGTGQLEPGDHVLMVGIAPGVSVAGAVVEVLEIPPWAEPVRPSSR
ncbi:ketoacyl-ACP synthase III family protein [Amycolatopsis australiensis]|uniref:3-oxoacyl-[acyl-carrier-protein] synthase-3 n=1 Tax=Amycolatopsis australiensis TaxID=546364 RepID=A0A1K1RUK2_9PSEU|nr:ketoacyl-ACP synthase III family protein [Amycolatopsis australiensis]SFW75758.1 3-oxoacyl-[acyl-carrier-protein] synthase-3 [Amycolatopsis australiensis]